MLFKHTTDTIPYQVTPTSLPLVPIPQSKIDTTSWKRYVNPIPRFSFKYPPTGSIHINQVHGFETDAYLSSPNTIELDTVDTHESPYILLKYYPQPRQTSLTDSIKTLKDYCIDITPTGGNKIIVGGTNAKFYHTNCGVVPYDAVFVQGNTIFYYITINRAYDKKFFDTFLSTISFTK